MLAAEVKVDELVEADMAAREAGKGERALELTISYTGAACRYETRTAATGANDDGREPTLGDSSFSFRAPRRGTSESAAEFLKAAL